LVERRAVHKNGTLFDIELSSKLIGDKALSMIRDISERKRAEEQLRESERFLNNSQSVSKIGSYVLDLKTGEWKSSQELNIFGLTVKTNVRRHGYPLYIRIIKDNAEYFEQEDWQKQR
jgi:PAS domain-containing protein